jgi:DNA-binding response OmpR family regulator
MTREQALREHVSVLEEELRQTRAQLVSAGSLGKLVELDLSRSEMLVLGSLMDGVGDKEKLDAKLNALNGPYNDAAPGPRRLALVVMKLRRKLPGVVIRSAWGVGYWMSKEDIESVRALIA